MININFKKEKDSYTKLIVKGHAEFDVAGKDLVCAGVTAIVTGGLTALDNAFNNRFSYKVSDALIEININNIKLDNKALIIMETIYYQLKNIYIQYKKYVNFQEEQNV
ncbi:ribosomal-processing cysteine protease Prp [Spiroplasma endosymbiont of Anurida maritima]|uniref:ribosomal-processing cysteine protease Prp n=1 Tax=Spiroplasma endosymbiont of Anurida maritima TaxID=2967972 RepID=UPI0036D312E3